VQKDFHDVHIPMGNSWQIKENRTTTDPWLIDVGRSLALILI